MFGEMLVGNSGLQRLVGLRVEAMGRLGDRSPHRLDRGVPLHVLELHRVWRVVVRGVAVVAGDLKNWGGTCERPLGLILVRWSPGL